MGRTSFGLGVSGRHACLVFWIRLVLVLSSRERKGMCVRCRVRDLRRQGRVRLMVQ